MKKPYILITNDDGIKAKGIKELCRSLQPFADILAVSPAKQRSGAAQSITIWKSFRVKKAKLLKADAYTVCGTPVDCVKFGILNLAKRKPDLVISGINHGPNFGRFILYSGTVGAAKEGAIMGVKSLSVSYDDFSSNPDFSFAAEVTVQIAKKVISGNIKIKKDSLLNVNIPNITDKKYKGVKVLPKGRCQYREEYKKRKKNGKTEYIWWISGKLTKSGKYMTDSEAVEKGYVVLTPLHLDYTDYKAMKGLEKIKLGL